jgi:hypothetical protein
MKSSAGVTGVDSSMLDVIALTLEEARSRLAAAGLAIRMVSETRPPHRAELTGDLRVVRVRGAAGAVDLVVTRERYVASAGQPHVREM